MAKKFELTKTYQYRKVMKPLLERKRRARINKCLDDLKDLMAECLQQQNGDGECVKVEKADILEVTVQHLRKLKAQKSQQQPDISASQSFRAGYIKAAHEVSRCLASLPNIDIAFGTKLMTDLGARLNQLEAPIKNTVSVQQPLSIVCDSTYGSRMSSALYSPGSGSYASDNSEYNETEPMNARTQYNKGILQTVSPVWRPW